jgi:hypothetical protein
MKLPDRHPVSAIQQANAVLVSPNAVRQVLLQPSAVFVPPKAVRRVLLQPNAVLVPPRAARRVFLPFRGAKVDAKIVVDRACVAAVVSVCLITSPLLFSFS